MKERVKKYIKNCFWLGSEEGKNSKEIYALNAMRFIAFLFIFIQHSTRWIKVRQLYHAQLGVSFFIVVSGFLNGYLKKETGKVNIKTTASYVKRKMSKLYPLFLVVLLVTLWRVGFFNINSWGALGTFLSKFIPGVTLTSSWINSRDHYFAFFGGIWYMSTFLFLMIMTPLLTKIISKIYESRHGVTKLIILAGVLYLLSMVWVGALNKEYYFMYIFPPARLFEYVIGMIFGKLMSRDKATKTKQKKQVLRKQKVLYSILETSAIASVFICATIVFINGEQNLPIFITKYMNAYILPLVFMLCVFVKQKGVLSYLLSNKPMVLLGRASMYLYLIHQPIIYLFDKKFAHKSLYAIYVLGITIIISLYLYNRSKKNANSSSGIQK